MLFKKDRNKDELYESVSVRQGFPPTNREIKARMLRHVALARQRSAVERRPRRRCERCPIRSTATSSGACWKRCSSCCPRPSPSCKLVFQTQGEADYVEIALRALRALGTADEPTDLALAFDYRLQHILVDEFQDTSFSQLDLLERLTGGWADGDGRTLFCVGDPMQSIYRFRQAEVGLFIDLQQHGLRNLRLQPLRLGSEFPLDSRHRRLGQRVVPGRAGSAQRCRAGRSPVQPEHSDGCGQRRWREGSYVRQRRRRHRGCARGLDRSRHAGTDPPRDASRFWSRRALTWTRSHAS